MKLFNYLQLSLVTYYLSNKKQIKTKLNAISKHNELQPTTKNKLVLLQRLRKNSTKGYDQHYNESINTNNELIYNISKNFHKKSILDKLTSNIPNVVKLEKINEYNMYHSNISMAPNIQAGRLYDDWNNVF